MKKAIKKIMTITLCVCMMFSCISTAEAGWRKTKSKTVRGYSLTAKADLPYWSDSEGGGAWKTQAVYKGIKVGNKLTTSWSFYTIGGSASWSGMEVSGNGSNSGDSYTARANTVNANGYVYGTGFCLYVGMISTASFSYGNTYYSISCKI